MTKQFNLSEAASSILEGSKETFAANVAAKRGSRSGNPDVGNEVGINRVSSKTAYGTNDAGEIGQSPEEHNEPVPNYTKGTPQATPPGATPPVSGQKDGVGAAVPSINGQKLGRQDLVTPTQSPATDYSSIRDRVKAKLAPQMMAANKGSVGIQSYGEGIDLSDDVAALLEGENLSEEFAQKATTIFEAAVMSKAQQVVEQVEAKLVEQFEEELETIKEDLASKVDDYLNYMVEEWVTENKLAIEKGLRAELVEDFIGGLRNLFVEHYIDIPAEKVDIVEELTTKIEELEGSLNEQINRAVELTKELNEQKKIEAIYAVCEGLTQTQVEKMKSLAEGVEFTNDEEFATKLVTLKESYFKSEVVVANSAALDDEVTIEEEPKKARANTGDALMETYAKTISQTLVK
jgi:uncharacterized FlaG/YvyC family protein